MPGELDETTLPPTYRPGGDGRVDISDVVIALKGADEQMREKLFRNMSKRAAEMLRDDIDVKGPVRVSEVEGAQKEILAVARRMAEEGTIVLANMGGEEFV